MKNKKKSKRIAITIVLIVLLLFLILLVSGLVFARKTLGKIERIDVETRAYVIPAEEETFEVEERDAQIERDQDRTEEIDEPEEVVLPEEVELQTVHEENMMIETDDLINILLVGQDARPGEGRGRSDAMILVSLNTDTGKVSMISFMRDLYVQIPGYSDNRLNAAYRFGDIPLLYDTFELNFGLKIDGCFTVRFEALIAIIDLLGGVDIQLTENEAWVLNLSKTGTFSAGMNHLNGTQAKIYASIRMIDNDFYRTGRQRAVLLAVYKKFKDADLKTLMSLLDTVLPYLSTDMSNGEILMLSTRVLPLLSSMEISTYRVPSDDAYYGAMIRGMSVLVPDLSLIRSQLQNEYLPLE